MDQIIDSTASPASLRIRPVRLFGRRVNGCAIRIPASGLVMGGENGALSLDAALHVLPQHAEVRAEAGGFHLVPGCGVVALNGERLEQQDSRRLQPGDCVEIGFAALRVEADDPTSLTGNESACDGSALHAKVPKLVPGFLPGFFPEKSAIQTKSAPDSETAPQEASLPEPVSSEAEALLALLLDTEAPEPVAPAENVELAENRDAANKEDAKIAAGRKQTKRAAARLDIMTMPEVTDTGLMPARQPKPAEPAGILTDLARESARVLAGGRMETTTPFADLPVPVPVPEPDVFPLSGRSGAAASLEEILEGPLSIDDVLENLRRRDPQTAQSPTSVNDVLAAMAAPPRAPDPLRLLAGLDDRLPLREPELPPVLGREHRSPGMSTPYSAGMSGPPEQDFSPFPPLSPAASPVQMPEPEQLGTKQKP